MGPSDARWIVRAVQRGINVWDVPDAIRAERRRNTREANQRRSQPKGSKGKHKRPRARGAWSNGSLRMAGFATYNDYLSSPEWRQRRLKVMRAAKFKCPCGAHAAHVHHVSYLNAGNELPGDLMAVCASCHRRIHRRARKAKLTVQQATQRVMGAYLSP